MPSVLHQWRRPLTISVVVAALLYIAAVMASDGGEVMSQLGQLPVGLVAVLFVLPTCGFLIRFVRWEFLLRSLGHEVPRLRHARIYLAGFALTTTPGKVGENLRAMFLLPHGVPLADSFGAFVAERLGDLIVMVTLSALMFGLVGSYVWPVAASAIVTLAGVVLLRDPRFSAWLADRGSPTGPRTRRGGLGRAMVGAGRALQASRSLLGPKLLVLGVALAFVAWSAEGLTFALAARYLGIEVSVTVAVGIFALGTLLGALSFLPGGVGPTEAVMGGLLVLAGGTLAEATAATLLVRATTLWWAVLIGAGALIGLGAPPAEGTPPAEEAPSAEGAPPSTAGPSPPSKGSPFAG